MATRDSDFEDELEGIGDDDAWSETETMETPSTCLFCPQIFPEPDAVFSHCTEKHDFNIVHIARLWHLDCFGYIKMVNYIRTKNPDPKLLCERQSFPEPPWISDDFMKPFDPEDEMLQYDIEELNLGSQPPEGVTTNTQNSTTSVSPEDIQSLIQRLQAAELRAKQSEENLQRVLSDMENMKSVTRDLMMSQPEATQLPRPSDTNGRTNGRMECEEEDDPYFSSYGQFGIHEEMLKDRVRTESYRDFMYKNKDVLRDKVVLDVGCGTGILSMFAVQAGAKHVYAVDMAEIIYQAMDIARENNMSNKITFIKGKLEDIKLPSEKVDIIISEWMGYFLLFESMLDSVLYARAKYLKPGGAVYPDRCNISLTALSDLDLYNKHVTFWDDVYGFKMGCMKSCVVREASVEVVDKQNIISDAGVLTDLDIINCGLEDLQFSSDFCLTINRDGPVTALIGFFDTFFEKGCSEKVGFTTGPHSTATHWKQSVFLLDTPLHTKQGDQLIGKLSCRKNRKDPRSLIIDIKLNDRNYTYYME